MAMMREPLVSRVIRAGELMVSGENQAEVDSYFDTAQFVFHGPGGVAVNYTDLMGYFAAVRAGFDDRSIRRGMVVAEGDYMACQTWIEGTFAREFTLHRRVP